MTSTIYIYEEDGVFQATRNHDYAYKFALEDAPNYIVVGIGTDEAEAIEALKTKEELL